MIRRLLLGMHLQIIARQTRLEHLNTGIRIPTIRTLPRLRTLTLGRLTQLSTLSRFIMTLLINLLSNNSAARLLNSLSGTLLLNNLNGLIVRHNPLMILSYNNVTRVIRDVKSNTIIRVLGPRLNILKLITHHLNGSVQSLGMTILFNLKYVMTVLNIYLKLANGDDLRILLNLEILGVREYASLRRIPPVNFRQPYL